MKNWRTILITTVIVLLVAILGWMVLTNLGSETIRDTKGRIRQYKLVREEQELIRDILQFRYETALLQAKFQPAPLKPAPLIKE